MKHRLYWHLATCGGVGMAPIAPGTFTALWGVAIYLLTVWLLPAPAHTPALVIALLISCWVTIALAPWAEAYFQTEDSKNFVTDEVAGFLFTVVLFRVPNVWITAATAFFVTRAIDVIKVPPARSLEKLPAGWGVLADDLLSSVYAAGLLHLLAWQFPSAFLLG